MKILRCKPKIPCVSHTNESVSQFLSLPFVGLLVSWLASYLLDYSLCLLVLSIQNTNLFAYVCVIYAGFNFYIFKFNSSLLYHCHIYKLYYVYALNSTVILHDKVQSTASRAFSSECSSDKLRVHIKPDTSKNTLVRTGEASITTTSISASILVTPQHCF